LTPETEKRAMTGFLLTKYPLSVDTLVIRWDSLLVDKQIVAKKRIRYIYTDEDLQNDTAFTTRKGRITDSLTVRYLGFRCEHELVTYVAYPLWLSDLSFVEWLLLLLPWGVLLLLASSYTFLENFIKKKFFREKVIEKEIHVADVKIDEAKIFLLPDGSLFDTFTGILSKGEISRQLPPQSIILLKLFLQKENHHLSSSEIEQELWKGKGTIDQLHKAIQRLRAELKKVSSEIVIKNINGDYELKSPFSSEKNE
jgi:DNA-binding winged helix-turn-helix (wHTH) protein